MVCFAQPANKDADSSAELVRAATWKTADLSLSISQITSNSEQGTTNRKELTTPTPRTSRIRLFWSCFRSVLILHKPQTRDPSHTSGFSHPTVVDLLCSSWAVLAFRQFFNIFVAPSAFEICSGRPRSMYMWSPHDIGRESWVWEEQRAL